MCSTPRRLLSVSSSCDKTLYLILIRVKQGNVAGEFIRLEGCDFLFLETGKRLLVTNFYTFVRLLVHVKLGDGEVGYFSSTYDSHMVVRQVFENINL